MSAYKPWIYQQFAEEHLMNNRVAVLPTNGGSGLFLDMGLGKTVIALTAVERLLFETYDVEKVLVIAPKRVAEHTWGAEIEKWGHLNHLTLSKIIGPLKDRKAALKAKADIYTINVENVVWLVAELGSSWPFDMVILDELTKFKSAKSARFKALRQIRPMIKRIVGLTGTPAPNGLEDLWSQMYLLDRGERLYKTLTEYRDTYFTKNAYTPYAKYEVHRERDELVGAGYYEKKIYNKVADICISMRASDYLELPDKIFNDVDVCLDESARAKYDEFEKKLVLELLEEDATITAVNAAVLTNKLLQFANGAVYDENGTYHEIHDEKLNELAEIIDENHGKPIIVFYSYRHDADRIRKRFAALRPVDLKGPKEIDRWNRKEIPLMLAHPASAGHGLNLQAGGNIIVFFGLLWSLELYLQAIARLHRQGQTEAVIVHRLIAGGTMDNDVIAALDSKESGQNALMSAVKARIEKYRPKN